MPNDSSDYVIRRTIVKKIKKNTQKPEQNSVNLLNERINRNITQNEIFKCIKI